MDIRIKIPTYTTTLPSTKKEIEYRPFTVAEEKIYLIADETGSVRDKFSALKQIVSNCTNGVVDVSKVPLCDTEWIIAKIRGKSKGEELPLRGYCTKCEEWSNLVFDMNTLEVTGNENKIEKKVMLSEDVGVTLRFPSYDLFVEDGNSISERTFDVIEDCIECIFQGDVVHDRKDLSKDEISDFLNSLPSTALEKLTAFFDTMPQVIGTFDWTCKCGHKNTTEVSGLHNFFG